MDDFVTRVVTDLVGRVEGPMKFRLIIQPLVACVFAVHAGLRDARDGRSPYFWALAFNTGDRRELLGQGWKDIAKLFVVAVILDGIYQLIELHMVYPGEAIVVPILLAIIPYLLVRAAVTRLVGRKKHQP
jgi:hypothetical protein